MPFDAAVILDGWFKQNCDGQWEHQYGITVESTDNPGWLASFHELQIDKELLSNLIGSLLRNQNAQVSADGTMVRVYAPSLGECLEASAILVDATK